MARPLPARRVPSQHDAAVRVRTRPWHGGEGHRSHAVHHPPHQGPVHLAHRLGVVGGEPVERAVGEPHRPRGVDRRVEPPLQMEPVWGGTADTAGTLRGNCALALVGCRSLSDLDVLSHLVNVLVDLDKTVRIEAARAIGSMNRREGALVLRLRTLTGDPEPEVIGACFAALLSIEGRDGFPFVTRFLDAAGEVRQEAAIALALTHDPEVFQILKDRWERETDPALLLPLALTRQPGAMELLLHVIEGGERGAEAAIGALASVAPEMRPRVEAAVSGALRLAVVFRERFGG